MSRACAFGKVTRASAWRIPKPGESADRITLAHAGTVRPHVAWSRLPTRSGGHRLGDRRPHDRERGRAGVAIRTRRSGRRDPRHPRRTPAARARLVAPLTSKRGTSVAWASVLSHEADWPIWRLQHRVPNTSRWFTTRATMHPALIPQEVPAGSRRRLAIPAKLEAKRPALAGNPRRFPLNPEPARPACHAGGRGFESRRSRSRKPAPSGLVVLSYLATKRRSGNDFGNLVRGSLVRRSWPRSFETSRVGRVIGGTAIDPGVSRGSNRTRTGDRRLIEIR
jgi:hypothetical protein